MTTSVIERIAVHIAEEVVSEISHTVLSVIERNPDSVLLDCGCNNGELALKVAKKIGTKNVYGVDIQEKNAVEARARGIKVSLHDLNEKLPFSDEMFDVVNASHIIEHLSNTDIFVRELYRVLKSGGYAVISTPNLSSLHNILYLMFGRQPPLAMVSDEVVVGGWRSVYCPSLPGPSHRRLFTFRALAGLCEYYGFQVELRRGSGFYPFPPCISRVLTRIMKMYSSDITIKVRKHQRKE
jgi:methionine biosynthesis protein MetW